MLRVYSTLETAWMNRELNPGHLSDRQQHTVTIPPHVARVGTRYRVRARVKDVTGRWSHWSAPIQFVAGEPDTAETLQANLKLTELMFNSPAGNEFDFVEWHNASPTVSLNLEGVTFAAGIDYTFPAGTMIEPMGYLVLVKANDFSINADSNKTFSSYSF